MAIEEARVVDVEHANRRPQTLRTTSQRDEQPTPLTPLGADRPRRHPDHRLSGTPKQTRYPGARNTKVRPHDPRPTTPVLGRPLPDRPRRNGSNPHVRTPEVVGVVDP